MKPILCPTCDQNLLDPPHKGLNNRDCPQCGQGIKWRLARRKKPLKAKDIAKGSDMKSLKPAKFYWTVYGRSLQDICSKHKSFSAALRSARKCEKHGGTRHKIVEVRVVR